MKGIGRSAAVLCALGLAAGLLAGCATALPPLDKRTATSAIADTGDTRLGRAVAAASAAHPGTSGIYGLPDAVDAFAVRGLLAAAADRSLDVQYYIWRGDAVGMLLFEALWQAAERGVRVRVLLDDNNTRGCSPSPATSDA